MIWLQFAAAAGGGAKFKVAPSANNKIIIQYGRWRVAVDVSWR